MRRPRARRWGWLVVLLLAGCQRTAPPKPAQPAADLAAQTAAAEAQRDAPASGAYRSREAVIAAHKFTPAKDVASFTWSASPTASEVPAGPVTGMLRQRPFLGQHVSLSVGEEDKQPVWRLRFSNKPRGEQCGFALDDDSVTLEWHTPTGPGELRKAVADARPVACDAWLVLEQADGAPLTATSEFGCYLRIEQLTGPTEEGGAPSLTGQIAITFADDDKSWLAGHFVADGCR